MSKPVLRTDGEWTAFLVEFFCESDQKHYDNEDCWHRAGDHFQAKVPVELRRNHDGHGKGPMHRQPFHDFSACGECWQETGIEGTYEESRAFDMAELLSKYNPGHKFRVVRIEVSQKRTELATFHRTEVARAP